MVPDMFGFATMPKNVMMSNDAILEPVVNNQYIISNLFISSEQTTSPHYTYLTLSWKENGQVKSTVTEFSDEAWFQLRLGNVHVIKPAVEKACDSHNYPLGVAEWMYLKLTDIILKSLGMPAVPAQAVNPNSDVANLAWHLPGVQQEAEAPCRHDFGGKVKIYNLIMHLNDKHKWSREKIADWLEELSVKQGIDLYFPVPDDL